MRSDMQLGWGEEKKNEGMGEKFGQNQRKSQQKSATPTRQMGEKNHSRLNHSTPVEGREKSSEQTQIKGRANCKDPGEQQHHLTHTKGSFKCVFFLVWQFSVIPDIGLGM